MSSSETNDDDDDNDNNLARQALETLQDHGEAAFTDFVAQRLLRPDAGPDEIEPQAILLDGSAVGYQDQEYRFYGSRNLTYAGIAFEVTDRKGRTRLSEKTYRRGATMELPKETNPLWPPKAQQLPLYDGWPTTEHLLHQLLEQVQDLVVEAQPRLGPGTQPGDDPVLTERETSLLAPSLHRALRQAALASELPDRIRGLIEAELESMARTVLSKLQDEERAKLSDQTQALLQDRADPQPRRVRFTYGLDFYDAMVTAFTANEVPSSEPDKPQAPIALSQLYLGCIIPDFPGCRPIEGEEDRYLVFPVDSDEFVRLRRGRISQRELTLRSVRDNGGVWYELVGLGPPEDDLVLHPHTEDLTQIEHLLADEDSHWDCDHDDPADEWFNVMWRAEKAQRERNAKARRESEMLPPPEPQETNTATNTATNTETNTATNTETNTETGK